MGPEFRENPGPELREPTPGTSYEAFTISEGGRPNVVDLWKNFSVADYQRTVRLGELDFQEVPVDRVLFKDIAAHFPEVYRQLIEVDVAVRKQGPEVNQAIYDLWDAIYKMV